jgi:hypothetical protein
LAAGLTGTYTNPETGEQFEALYPAAALGAYFLLVFAVAHWPLGQATEAGPRAAPDRPARPDSMTSPVTPAESHNVPNRARHEAVFPDESGLSRQRVGCLLVLSLGLVLISILAMLTR